MLRAKVILFCMFLSAMVAITDGQTIKTQQGLFIKKGTDIRLGNIRIINKRSLVKASSNTYGVFNILASTGDTLVFTSDNFQTINFVVSDFMDRVIYLEPVIQLDEVVVKENSLKKDIKEVQRGYREKSVFYTGTPHYYYLVLKPMTFIYENFKGEVKDARRFNCYARKALASYQVTTRFNDATIKKAVPIKDAELEDFEVTYMPTLKQINAWNDYELINYIKSSYADYLKNSKPRDSSKR